jgi:hypothetical protein
MWVYFCWAARQQLQHDLPHTILFTVGRDQAPHSDWLVCRLLADSAGRRLEERSDIGLEN